MTGWRTYVLSDNPSYFKCLTCGAKGHLWEDCSMRVRITWPSHVAGETGTIVSYATAETANVWLDYGDSLVVHRDNFQVIPHKAGTGYAVRLIRTTFLDSEVFEGDYLNAPSTETEIRVYDGMHLTDMVRMCRDNGLTFEASGNDWASNPDGSQIVDYREGRREEVTFHFVDVPERLQLAVIDAVG